MRQDGHSHQPRGAHVLLTHVISGNDWQGVWGRTGTSREGVSPGWSAGHVPTSRGRQVSDYVTEVPKGAEYQYLRGKIPGRWNERFARNNLRTSPSIRMCVWRMDWYEEVSGQPPLLSPDRSSISPPLVPVKVSMTIVGKCLTSGTPVPQLWLSIK